MRRINNNQPDTTSQIYSSTFGNMQIPGVESIEAIEVRLNHLMVPNQLALQA